jgi:hypothetical protein
MPERDAAMAIKTTNYNSVLRDLQSSFRTQYKYKILGQTDSFFQYTAKMIENDQTKLSLFKSRRTAEQSQLAKITNNTALTENEKLQQSAQVKVGYLKDAYRTIKSATYDPDIKTTNLKYSVSYFMKELEQAVKDYISSRGGEASADTSSEDIVDLSEEAMASVAAGGSLSEADQKFFGDVQKIVDDMARVTSKLRIKVRSEGIFFDNTTYQASKRVKIVQEMLASIQSGSAATAAAPAGESLDVTV